MPSKRPNKTPSSIPSSVRGIVVGIAQMDTQSVAGIVHNILKDRNCRQLGTAMGTSKFQRAMVTDRMLIDAARQLAREASDNPLDFRYGLCVFGMMPAHPAPGTVRVQFMHMCKAFSVAMHVLDAMSIADINTIRATAKYMTAHVMYGHVRARNPLETMTGVHEGLLAVTQPFSPRLPTAGYHEARQVNRQGVLGPYNATQLLPADHHRIEFLRHVFYLTLSNGRHGQMPIASLNLAIRRLENTYAALYLYGNPDRSDAAQRELALAILHRVPQLYYCLSTDDEHTKWTNFDTTKALAAVVEGYRQTIDTSPFSPAFAQGVRIAEQCNVTFMRTRGRNDMVVLASTWLDTMSEEGSFVDDMVRVLTRPTLRDLLKKFPRYLTAVTDAHLENWERAWIDKLKSVIQDPELQQYKTYIFDERVRSRLGL